MKRFLAVVILGFTAFVGVATLQQPAAGAPPTWAWGVTGPIPTAPPPAAAPAAPAAAPAAPPADDGKKFTVPGSTLSLTRTEMRAQGPFVDWHGPDHPTMPDIVRVGRGAARACGLCHLPNGKGRAENAGVQGLTYGYIIQQLNDFRADSRITSDPRKTNTATMTTIAKTLTPEEMDAAAKYFSSMSYSPWIRVVESKTNPKVHSAGGMWQANEGESAGTEPLGYRIIEMPEDTARVELRDDHASFVAYVPEGSIKKGENMVTTGANGKTTQCAVCHGPDLKGMGPVPPIAGRSPSYLVRQMYDMQSGNRKGTWTPLMKPVVAKLTADDMVNIAAYVSSRTP